MQILKSLNCDVLLSPMQALLTGLVVMVPQDPWEFVAEKIEYIRDEGITDIQW